MDWGDKSQLQEMPASSDPGVTPASPAVTPATPCLTPVSPVFPSSKTDTGAGDNRAIHPRLSASPEATVVSNGGMLGFFGHKRRLPPASPKDNLVAMKNFQTPNVQLLDDTGGGGENDEVSPLELQQKRTKSKEDWNQTLLKFHTEVNVAGHGSTSPSEASVTNKKPPLTISTINETNLSASTPANPNSPLSGGSPSDPVRPFPMSRRKSVTFQTNLAETLIDNKGPKLQSVSVSDSDASELTTDTKVPSSFSRKLSNFSLRSTFSFRSTDGRASVSSTANGAPLSAGLDPEAGTTPRKPWRCTDAHRKVLVGLVVMAMGSVCWVGTTQCLIRLYNWPFFYAPFFVVYFCTAWTLVFFPIYVLARVCKTRCKLSLVDTFRDNFRVYTQDALAPCAPHKVFVKCTVFCLIWTLTSYVYIRALSFKSALDVSALFATNSNFVYLMSWIVLQKRFIAVRIVSFIVAMTGIIMITYVEAGFASDDMWGSVLVMISTAGAAVYKVLFRKIIGEVTYGQVSMFITFLGLSSSLMMWPFLLVLYFTKAEPIIWPEVPWALMCGAAGFAVGLNIVLTYGGVFTYQTFVQAGLVFAIPVCVAYEVVFHPSTFHVVGMQIGAYVLIILSFLLNILPEDWHETVLKALHWKQHVSRPEDAHMTPRQRVRSSVRQI